MLYTFGFERRSLHELQKLARDLDAVVIDIRLKRTARAKIWSGPYLSLVLGDKYIWREGLGNLNYRSLSAPIELSDPKDLDWLALLLQISSVILLDYDRNPSRGHSSYIVEKIKERIPDLQVQHL